MSNEEFMKKAINMVRSYCKDILEIEDDNFNIFIVWMCKTLQNSKALISTDLKDNRYYEVTLNGDKKEIYLDAYKKEMNQCIKLEEEEE